MIEKLKHTDKTTLIFSVFIVLISAVLLVAYKTKENIDYYTLQNNKIATLQLIDKELYDFSLTIDRLENYDVIEKQEEEFRHTFTGLSKVLQHYNTDTIPLLEKISKSFQQKVDDLEYFKAQNSSLINSSHFLFDLHTTIANASDISIETKNLVNETLFYILQYASNGYISTTIINQKLEQLKHNAKNEKSRYLSTFYKHAKLILLTLQALKEVSKEIQTNPLNKQLEVLKLYITKEYKKDLSYQTWLLNTFAFFTVFVLLALLLAHLESNKAKQKLIQAATVFENIEEAIIIADAQGEVISINTAFTKIYGYTLKEVKGKNLSLLHSGVHNKSFYKNLWNQLIENGIWKGKIINRTKANEDIPIWNIIKQIKDTKGDIVNYTAVQTDLREIEGSQEKIDYLAYHDALTGLYNRVSFEEHLQHALVMAKRNATILAILFLDLDRFKIINDTLGHDIGDEVLKDVASKLKVVLRDSDFISRWGGDEFVVILENLASTSDAGTIAENIIKKLAKPIDINGHELFTTASIGISIYSKNEQDSPQTLIKHADSAMYLAKERGKNNFRYYTKELSKDIQRKLDIDMALQNALQNNEFHMVFQPQYKFSTKNIVAAEALVRWQNPELGNITPDEFIPICEENGTIIPLGYFVFEESCKALKKMKEAHLQVKYIAINVSSLQFKHKNLLQTFIAIAKKYDLKPQEIEIEITERSVMEQTQTNMKMLQNFRSSGFKISIDDFGTGYSSMSYLKKLPADIIKIDKSFIDDITEKESPDNIIIEAIIALSKALDYTIIAEGIETEEQERFLTQANCDIGQGYLFSRPITCKEIIERFHC